MLRQAVVLPQPLVGEVIPIEVQPFCRITRRILVRIMSKVECAGSASAKVTIRLLGHQVRVGLEGRDLGPDRRRRRRLALARLPRRGERGPLAARLGRPGRLGGPAGPARAGATSLRCSLAF